MTKKCTIFYSWQSDIKANRNFISDCLNSLRKKMKDIVLCDIDRDTQGLAGAPDIGDSIYEKIDSADIFIADVTIINQDYAGRKTPNPNVLIELGYAIKALGSHFLVREGVWANDQFVDVDLKDGEYTVIEGSMRAVPKG